MVGRSFPIMPQLLLLPALQAVGKGSILPLPARPVGSAVVLRPSEQGEEDREDREKAALREACLSAGQEATAWP